MGDGVGRLLRGTSAFGLGLLSLYAGAANAQSAPGEESQAEPQETSGSNDILVTALRREQTLQEVPVAVSVISAQSLAETGVSAVDSLTDVVPSLTYTKGADPESSSLSIRGIGTTSFGAAVEPSVSVVVDDVVMARSGQSFQDLIDVQRVEVLRGPQSTLFGKNASAGVVSITTKAPTDHLTGSFDAMMTDDAEYQLRGLVSGPLGKRTAASVSGLYRDFAGNTRNVYNGKLLNGARSYAGRLKVRSELTDALEVTLIGDYRKNESTPQATVRSLVDPSKAALFLPVVVGDENMRVNVDAPIFTNSENYGGSLNAKYRFESDFVLNSITAYRGWNQFYNTDVDHTSQPPRPGPGNFTWNLNQGKYDLSQFSQEFRIESPAYDHYDFMVGAYFANLDLDHQFSRRWVYTTGGRSGSYLGHTETRNMAVFASGNVFLSDTLTMFGGLRLLNERLRYSVYRNPADVVVPGDTALPGEQGTLADFSNSTSDTVVTGNIGLRYELGSIGNAYASYSRGYKGAGFNLVFGTTETPPVKPEQVNAYEIGIKLSTADNVLSSNIALFYTDYNNYQAQSRGESEDTPFILRNAGQLVTKGIEAEFFLRPSDYTRVSVGAAWIDAHVKSFPNGPCYANQTEAEGCIDGAQDLAGADLPNSPDFKISVNARQTIPLAGVGFNAFVQGNGTYQTKVQYALTQDPRTIQPAYALLNASIGIEDKDGRYTMSIFGRNLTDKFYPGELFPSPSTGGRVTQTIPRNAGRYFGVRAAYNF